LVPEVLERDSLEAFCYTDGKKEVFDEMIRIYYDADGRIGDRAPVFARAPYIVQFLICFFREKEVLHLRPRF